MNARPARGADEMVMVLAVFNVLEDFFAVSQHYRLHSFGLYERLKTSINGC